MAEYYKYDFKDGEFIRPESRFRGWIRRDGSTKFQPEAGRYHLYVSVACPWSHRTVILRKLRKLEDVISMSVTSPVWNENGWTFDEEPGTIPDSVNHKRDIIDIYRLADPGFEGEETVPVLWDKKLKTIVSNESRDIIRMFDHEFSGFGDKDVDLCPPELQGTVDETITANYTPINNGVYQSGFARSQKAYERAVRRLFDALESWEERLGGQRYVCGDRLTEADVTLFVTLLRFDMVYYSHFKCNIRRIKDFPNLWAWTRDIYQTPGVAETCDFNHIKKHYYISQRDINPTGIVPTGPCDLDFMEPHGRERLPGKKQRA